MNKAIVWMTGLVLLWVAAVFSGCDETGSGGSGSSDVFRGEPAILDSALTISVIDDRPDGITDVFFSDTSKRIFLWIYWANVEGRHSVDVRWFAPDSALDAPPFREERETFSSSTGEQITWFFIERPSNGFPRGEWIVEIDIDDLFERSHLFLVE
ncbi:MAG: hypothetical protein OXN17_09285 [Candidatus Poribacteria bacterium]|nr:hypothetical protein [Candidatus Poribacteria bacterium]MDE0504029.1 hypothetical protein [Candidatus Poribacteria bacterium]